MVAGSAPDNVGIGVRVSDLPPGPVIGPIGWGDQGGEVGGTTPIRVGFVLHAMQVAGAEVLVAETIRRLGDRIRPTVFCLDSVGPLGELLLADGIDVVCLDRRPGRDLGVSWRMAQEVRSRDIEILHAHQYTPFFYAALAKLASGRSTRLIFTEHGRHYPDVVSNSRRLINRLFLGGRADAVNAVCGFSARSLAEVDGFPASRIEVIENGIDIYRYVSGEDREALRGRLGLDPHARYVACIARFHPVKGHHDLINAFAEAATTRPYARLLLAGEGLLRGQLEALAVSLGISDRIHFLGVRHDVPDLLRAADVFALTSVSEAASLTLLEAMASSRPVVVTAVGGNPEIIRDGVEGLLAPRGDIAAIATALGRLLDDEATAASMGAAGRVRVEERYQLGRTIETYAELYHRLRPVDRRRGRS